MALALVLGATGHIGAHVVRALLAEGHAVRAAYRTDRYLDVLDGLAVERLRLDLEVPGQLREAASGCDWVFHAAGTYPRAPEPPGAAVERSIATLRRVFEELGRANCSRIVFTSSAAAIRRPPNRLATEADAEPWSPHLPSSRRDESISPSAKRQVGGRPLYALVKTAMEHEALRAFRNGLPIVIVNPSVCIGEYDAHRFSGQAVLVFAKRRMPFYIDHTMNVVYTGDVGIAQVRAAERGRFGERYLLAGRNIALKDFAAIVARAAGTRPPRWRLPYPIALSAAAASEFAGWVTRTPPLLPRSAVHSTSRQGPGLDPSKARNELGLPQTPIEDAVARAVAWFRSHDAI